jgi:outer membrane protein OmpA-like peptidoglycan-associated protein
MRIFLPIAIALFFSADLHAQRKNDTFSVYFDLDVQSLNVRAKNRIDQLYANDKINRKAPIAIVGYADFLASEEYNLFLSQSRANNVKKYLGKFDLDLSEIRVVIGKGEIKRKDTMGKDKGVAEDRRVDIVMEYERAGKKNVDTEEKGDMTVVMHPREKTIPPPSTSDEGFEIENVPVGKSFILKNIYFPMGRHFPKQTSDEELLNLLNAMKENPNMQIQIEGHVCCITNVPDAYDLDSGQMDLSQNRARFIYEYLKARGIAADRISYIGYGKAKPIFVNEETQEQASVNRRVEIRIVKK